MQVPRTVNISLGNLVTLLNYYSAAVQKLGDLGDQTYEEMILKIGQQCKLSITPNQLESLIYHMKQAIFEKLKPVKAERRVRNYNVIMKQLSLDIPQLFKTQSSGEITMINFNKEDIK